MSPRNKPCLQLALYARPKHPGTYHYALFLAPKSADQAPITKHHVKNTLQIDAASGETIQPWRYEQTAVDDVTTEARLLVRITIAKVAMRSRDQVCAILEKVPVYQVDDIDKPAEAELFSCRTWVRDAFQELRRQRAVTAKTDLEWEDVEREALEYLDTKREQGRWDSGWHGRPGVPLMDLLEGRETVE